MIRSLSEPWFVPMRMRDPALEAEPNERSETLADPRQLGRILLVGVLDDLELLRVGVIARIDPHLLDPLGRFHGGFGFEMDVGHDRHVAAALAQAR